LGPGSINDHGLEQEVFMQRITSAVCGVLVAATVAGCSGGHDDRDERFVGTARSAVSGSLQNNTEFPDPSGRSASFSTSGSVDLTGTFFQQLGTNGRACLTCHQPGQGWTVSAAGAQAAFDASGGTDALFEFDGQNCVGADRSTVEARRAASSLMLDRGVVRFFKVIPDGAEFQSIASEGTYCNVVDSTNLVVYRRPLPTTNFGALSTVLWDGLGNVITPTIDGDLGAITIGATQLHAQTSFVPSADQVNEIVALMRSLTTAQTFDNFAKELTATHALGGPENLAHLAITGSPGFTIYESWTDVPGGGTEAARRSIAHGEAIFNTRPIQITGVAGLTDRVGTCSTCHGVPNLGNGPIAGTLAIGVADAAHRPADLPLYTLRSNSGETVQVSDPGHALVTGAWADIGKFKVPVLRGLAARAPYFHNGIAATLEDVVEFYDARFDLGLDGPDEEDLINFLMTL
jgi:cytochrome c peroxidase